MKYFFYSVVMLFPLLLGSCTVKQVAVDDFSNEPLHAVIALPDYAQDVMQAVEDRNMLVEKDPKWVEKSYSGLYIKRLNDIPYSDYGSYAKYVDNGSVYVIVHPAYYPFFHSKKPIIDRTEENIQSSVVDLFTRENADKSIIRYMQEQTKNEKNFIEYMSMKGSLVILVFPRNYPQHPSYAYGSESSGFDEFARYVNEITNGAESVVYIESNSPTGGKLLPSDQVMLFSFLSRIGAEKVFIGGGYVGRCQGEFYKYVTSYATMGNYVIVPEISVFSPEDISEKRAEMLLNAERDNSRLASAFISRRMSGRPNMQHIATWQLDSANSRTEALHQSRLSLSVGNVAVADGAVPLSQEDVLPHQDDSPEQYQGGYY